MFRISVSLALLLLLAGPVQATLRIWPGGPAPCDTTLNACLQGAGADDTVQVATNAPIDESPFFDKSLTLMAAPGFSPVIVSGNTLTAGYFNSDNSTWHIDIEGFTLAGGYLRITQHGGNGTVTIKHMNVTTTPATSDGNNGIQVETYDTAHAMHYEIAGNLVSVSSPNEGCSICVISSSGGTTIGSVHDNRIVAQGTSFGILAQTNGPGSSMLIYSNQIRQGSGFLLYVETQGTGAANAVVVNNSMACADKTAGYGLQVTAFSPTTVHAWNNTVANCDTGLSFAGSDLSGEIRNNIATGNSSAGIYAPTSVPNPPLSNDYNLVYNNGDDNEFAPGPHTITADPLIVYAPSNLNLSTGSPAIDAGDSTGLSTLLSTYFLPEIDANGSRRFKGATNLVDVGAFEFGDVAVAKIVDATGVIDSPALNGNGALLPQLIQTSVANSVTAPASDPKLTGIEFVSGKFKVIEETTSNAPTPLSGYNVFAPAPGNGVFDHLTSAANNFNSETTLNDPSVNNEQLRIVLATHRPTPAFNHPFGLKYGFGSWFIQETDGGNMPVGLHFDVYAQDASLNAFVWTNPSAGTATVLDHPLLNGQPCGRVYATSDTSVAHPFAVRYAQDRWQIATLDGGQIPVNAQFYVVVDEAAFHTCDEIFHGGFDPAP